MFQICTLKTTKHCKEKITGTKVNGGTHLVTESFKIVKNGNSLKLIFELNLIPFKILVGILEEINKLI